MKFINYRYFSANGTLERMVRVGVKSVAQAHGILESEGFTTQGSRVYRYNFDDGSYTLAVINQL